MDPRRVASDRSLAAFFRDTTRRLHGSISETENLLIFDGGSAPTRGAMRVGPAQRPAASEVLDLLDRAFEHAAAGGFAVTARSGLDDDLAEALTLAGYRPGMDLAGMVLERRQLEPRKALGAEVTIAEVRSVDEARDFRMVVAEAFEKDRTSVEQMFADPAVLTAPGIVAMVARVGQRPASAAMIASHDGVAAVDWVATRPAFRGKGLAEAVTRAVSQAAFDRGDRFAALQAAPDAARLYARLGFLEVCRYRWFRSPARS